MVEVGCLGFGSQSWNIGFMLCMLGILRASENSRLSSRRSFDRDVFRQRRAGYNPACKPKRSIYMGPVSHSKPTILAERDGVRLKSISAGDTALGGTACIDCNLRVTDAVQP